MGEGEGERLLRGILERPDDDALRLVYADWLEERGHDWQPGFIRAQIAIAGFLSPDLEARTVHLGVRSARKVFLPPAGQKALVWLRRAAVREPRLLAHVTAWKRRSGARFRRGFVEHVKMPLGDFLRHAGAVFAAQPVTGVTITDAHDLKLAPEGRTGPAPRPASWSWTGFRFLAAATATDYYHSHADWPCTEAVHAWSEAVREALEHERWPSAEAAVAAFHHACVNWGRALNDLPPLPGPPA